MAAKPIKNLDSFKAAFDPATVVTNKLRAGLAALAKDEGATAWEEESKFLRRAGVSNTVVGQYRDAFKSHVVEAKNANRKPCNVWFVDPKLAAEARKTQV